MKVGELSGEALDWAVAVADGRIPEDCDTVPTDGFSYSPEGLEYAVPFSPSSNWNAAGRIIARECISIEWNDHWGLWLSKGSVSPAFSLTGITPLEAAMRYFVFRKLGAEVAVPDALV